MNYQNQTKFEEVLKALLKRDLEDLQVDTIHRKQFLDEGLILCQPQKTITIDTGEIVGIENVVEKIISEIEPQHQFIQIHGESGTGKSSTAEKLQEELSAIKFSLGEVFRYLTYQALLNEIEEFERLCQALNYEVAESKLHLYHGARNITLELVKELREPELEAKIPQIAAKTQRPVIQFIKNQSEILRTKTERHIIIEGRKLALDFLPADLQVFLTASAEVRAKRRMMDQAT